MKRNQVKDPGNYGLYISFPFIFSVLNWKKKTKGFGEAHSHQLVNTQMTNQVPYKMQHRHEIRINKKFGSPHV